MDTTKLISLEAACRRIDADRPPHPRTLKRWPGFPATVKPSGKPNGREWLVEAEFDAWLKQLQRNRGAS
jgi:hypothetical protein